MIIGCFALVEPFTSVRRQFELIREMGIRYVDLTDNHDGAALGAEAGFVASLSLDGHPAKIRRLLEGSFSQLPQAVGMNNHMGSLATADQRVMNLIMEYLQSTRRFYLDSRTTRDTVVGHGRSLRSPLFEEGCLLGQRTTG